MAVKIVREGNYELFVTENDNRILSLDGDTFAIAQGQKGEILTGTGGDHQKKKTENRGNYKLVEFDDDARFTDLPHLFLADGSDYIEHVIPRGLPSEKGEARRIVFTDNRIGVQDLNGYLKSPRSGEGAERRSRPKGKSISNLTHHLRGIDFPASRSDILQHARDRDAPQEVIDHLEKLDSQSFENMAEVSSAIGEKVQAERPPIDDYDRKNVDEITAALDDLDDEGIEKVRDYETATYGRKTILDKADILLEDEAPVEDYFEMTADELVEAIGEMQHAELQELESYEAEHKNRKTVLEAIERRQEQ